MMMGLGLFTVAGVAAAVFYVVHHIVVKTTLFLVAGLVDRRAGTSRLSSVGGLVRTAPVIAALFAVPALSLAGLPPFSGFLAKFALTDAGLAQSSHAIVAVGLAVGLFTLFSMTKIWTGVFWGSPDTEPERPPQTADRFGGPPLMVLATLSLVAISVGFSIWAGPIHELSQRAAQDLLDPSHYINAVIEGATP